MRVNADALNFNTFLLTNFLKEFILELPGFITYVPWKKRDYAIFEDRLREMIFCEKVVKSAKKSRWVRI
ncbi:MAG: hypothetical protein LBF63_04615 [Treponema sp.]|nr:hypothetical protein [Treponema sp.]